MMIWGREIANPNDTEIGKEMTKLDPEIVLSQDFVNLIWKMVISGREIENPNDIEIWKERQNPTRNLPFTNIG